MSDPTRTLDAGEHASQRRARIRGIVEDGPDVDTVVDRLETLLAGERGNAVDAVLNTLTRGTGGWAS